MTQTEANQTPEFIRSSLSLLLNEAAQKAKRLQAEADEAARVQAVWKDLTTYLEKGWHLHIRHLLGKEAALIKSLQVENYPAVASLLAIQHESQEKANNLLRRYPGRFEEACNQHELKIDQDSRHPRYNFDNGFFKLEINESKGLAVLSNYEKGKLIELPADVEPIIEALIAERKRIFSRPFQGKKFLKLLRTQYLAILKKEQQPDGSPISIREITKRLGKTQKGFHVDEFLIDLSRLVEQGPNKIDGFLLDLQQTKDINKGMLLHSQSGRGYVGFILFKKG